jgi:aspartate oxidase
MESPAVAPVMPSVGVGTSGPTSSLPRRDGAEVIVISPSKKGKEKTNAASEGIVEEQTVEALANDTVAAAKAAAPEERVEALANEAPVADKAAMPTPGVEAAAKDTSTADMVAKTVTRAEAMAKDALIISTPAAPSKAVGTSSSAPKPSRIP